MLCTLQLSYRTNLIIGVTTKKYLASYLVKIELNIFMIGFIILQDTISKDGQNRLRPADFAK